MCDKQKALRGAWAGLALCIAQTGPARAEGPSPLPEWEYAAGIALIPRVEPDPPRWSVALGAGLQWQPRYDGAHDYRFMTDPVIDVRYRDFAFASTVEGVGVNLLRKRDDRAGVAITYDAGRARGAMVGKVNPCPELKVFAEHVFFPLVLRADLRRGFGGHNGWIGDVSAYAPLFDAERVDFFAGVALTVADRHYMSSYFGVPADLASRSGEAIYDPRGGVKSLSFGGDLAWTLSDHWLFDGFGGAARFLGPAKRSPILEENPGIIAGATLAYMF